MTELQRQETDRGERTDWQTDRGRPRWGWWCEEADHCRVLSRRRSYEAERRDQCSVGTSSIHIIIIIIIMTSSSSSLAVSFECYFQVKLKHLYCYWLLYICWFCTSAEIPNSGKYRKM